MTAISHRGLRNCFFLFFTLHLLFPISIWTFISLFYLDLNLPFLFGLLFRDISRHFETFRDISRHFETFQDISRHFETFRSFFDLSNRGLILDFFQILFFNTEKRFLGSLRASRAIKNIRRKDDRITSL